MRAESATAADALAADVRAGRVPPVDVVVWPENASDVDPFGDRAAYTAIDAAVRDVFYPGDPGPVIEA